MKKLYQYSENTDLFDITVGLESLFAEVSSLNSSFVWNEYMRVTSGKEDKLTGSIVQLHDNILSYKMKLEAFVENADYFNDTSCVDKFLNGSITKVRNQAIKSLNVLRSKANNSKDVKERNILLEALSSLKETVNMYIVIVQSIFEHKSGKLFNILKSRGIDYKEKYNLTQIE